MSGLEKAVAAVGILLHLAVGVFPYAVSGLVAPLWGVIALFGFWIALLALAVRLLRVDRRPLLVPLVPLAAVIVWFAFISFGGAVFGWTA